jgi:hypothetical protein
MLEALAGHIVPASGGPHTIGLNEGLHFTGGEPFLNYDLLCRGVETAHELGIPSVFVETNCFWCADERTVRDRLRELKARGMAGIMISVNPFYLEFVPFERTQRCIECSLEVFGENVAVYQVAYYQRFLRLGIREKMPLKAYIEREGGPQFLRGVEFFMQGRAPYAVPRAINECGSSFSVPQHAEAFLGERCPLSPARPWHNHFDNYGNYVPGFCGGLSYGDTRELDRLLEDGVDADRKPVLSLIMDEDIGGLFRFAVEHGYESRDDGYYSLCHLCVDARRHLAATGDFAELRPREFYRHLVGAPGPFAGSAGIGKAECE